MQRAQPLQKIDAVGAGAWETALAATAARVWRNIVRVVAGVFCRQRPAERRGSAAYGARPALGMNLRALMSSLLSLTQCKRPK
jgi:hypothetical protein